MNSAKNRQLLIVVAFILPLLFVIVVLAVSVIPSATLTTGYDFLYATCQDGSPPYSYYCRPYLDNRLYVDDGALMEREVPPELDSDRDGITDVQENYRVRLFLHDTTLNRSQEIGFDEAAGLQLLDRLTSPDDVAVEWETRGGNDFFFIFGNDYRAGYYLTRGNARQRLELINDADRYYYPNGVLFLGWVIP